MRCSVVIPAHNEESTLPRLLEALGLPDPSTDLEVVVVPNGCTDRTAEIAAEMGAAVVTLPEGSKIAALNAGDAAVSSFPRFYVDADVTVSRDAVQALAEHLHDSGVLAVAPALEVDTSRSSMLVRSYYRYWSALPSVSDSLAGRGCIGVSEEGRRRWQAFPDVLADDQFVNSQFAPDERRTVTTEVSVVVAPRDVRSLLRRRRRTHQGNVTLANTGVPGATSTTAWLGVVKRQPRRLVDLPAFVALTVLARLSTRLLAPDSWGTDLSSRTG